MFVMHFFFTHLIVEKISKYVISTNLCISIRAARDSERMAVKNARNFAHLLLDFCMMMYTPYVVFPIDVSRYS
jgi:hypothetical protein